MHSADDRTVLRVPSEPTARAFGPLPMVHEYLEPTTIAHRPVARRKAALATSFLAAPLAAGLAYARGGKLRHAFAAGGLAAMAIGALRVELARWFTAEPAYAHGGRIGRLELRHYETRIEASAEVDVPGLSEALDHGYNRLASYVCGANRTGELMRRTAPVLTAMRDGRYHVSFVMPPGRTLASLPRPTHPGIELREVPARAVATLRFRGRFTRDNVAAHERVLLNELLDAGLAARGSVSFAAFDWPVTLPLLRRNELWIDVVPA